MRRTAFAVLTFVLIQYSGLQVMTFIHMNILYLTYVASIDYYSSKHLKRLEIFNESFNVIISYNFLLLANLVPSKERRNDIGNSLLLIAGMLVGLNTAFLIF